MSNILLSHSDASQLVGLVNSYISQGYAATSGVLYNRNIWYQTVTDEYGQGKPYFLCVATSDFNFYQIIAATSGTPLGDPIFTTSNNYAQAFGGVAASGGGGIVPATDKVLGGVYAGNGLTVDPTGHAMITGVLGRHGTYADGDSVPPGVTSVSAASDISLSLTWMSFESEYKQGDVWTIRNISEHTVTVTGLTDNSASAVPGATTSMIIPANGVAAFAYSTDWTSPFTLIQPFDNSEHIATTQQLGIIKASSTLAVAPDGVASVPMATINNLGLVRPRGGFKTDENGITYVTGLFAYHTLSQGVMMAGINFNFANESLPPNNTVYLPVPNIDTANNPPKWYEVVMYDQVIVCNNWAVPIDIKIEANATTYVTLTDGTYIEPDPNNDVLVYSLPPGAIVEFTCVGSGYYMITTYGGNTGGGNLSVSIPGGNGNVYKNLTPDNWITYASQGVQCKINLDTSYHFSVPSSGTPAAPVDVLVAIADSDGNKVKDLGILGTIELDMSFTNKPGIGIVDIEANQSVYTYIDAAGVTAIDSAIATVTGTFTMIYSGSSGGGGGSSQILFALEADIPTLQGNPGDMAIATDTWNVYSFQ